MPHAEPPNRNILRQMNEDLHALGEDLISTAARMVRWVPEENGFEHQSAQPRVCWRACTITDQRGSASSPGRSDALNRRSPTMSSGWKQRSWSTAPPIRGTPERG